MSSAVPARPTFPMKPLVKPLLFDAGSAPRTSMLGGLLPQAGRNPEAWRAVEAGLTGKSRRDQLDALAHEARAAVGTAPAFAAVVLAKIGDIHVERAIDVAGEPAAALHLHDALNYYGLAAGQAEDAHRRSRDEPQVERLRVWIASEMANAQAGLGNTEMVYRIVRQASGGDFGEQLEWAEAALLDSGYYVDGGDVGSRERHLDRGVAAGSERALVLGIGKSETVERAEAYLAAADVAVKSSSADLGFHDALTSMRAAVFVRFGPGGSTSRSPGATR